MIWNDENSNNFTTNSIRFWFNKIGKVKIIKFPGKSSELYQITVIFFNIYIIALGDLFKILARKEGAFVYIWI